jgi:TRAP-type C4-dicarboxylate transport system substrate-binding protein
MRKLVLMAATLAVAGLLSASVTVAETTLKAVAFIPASHPVMWGSRAWADEINAALKGELKINYVGGPEIIPRRDQSEAVKNGVLDMAFIVTADLQDRIPESMGLVLSRLNPTQERESGFFDYIDGLFQERLNTKLLGRVQMSPFYLWLNKDAKNLGDLKGLKMRTSSLYDRLMRNFGMIPVSMNSPEVLTALDRGLVDGFGWPTSGIVKKGWAKHAKYVIYLPFFEWSNVVTTMNLDKWNALSASAQKTVNDVSIAFEPKMVAHYRAGIAKDWKELEAAGVKKIKFSDAENKEYTDAAYNLEWAALEKKVGAATVAKLKKLTGN